VRLLLPLHPHLVPLHLLPLHLLPLHLLPLHLVHLHLHLHLLHLVLLVPLVHLVLLVPLVPRPKQGPAPRLAQGPEQGAAQKSLGAALVRTASRPRRLFAGSTTSAAGAPGPRQTSRGPGRASIRGRTR
jgi:hypothetical protein